MDTISLLDKNKEIDLNTFQNKIIEKHRELDIPNFCLFLGSGCSKNSGIPIAPELIEILQKIIFVSRHKDYFSIIKTKEINIYEYLNLISNFVSKNSAEFKKFCFSIEKKFINSIETNLDKHINNIPINLSIEYKEKNSESLKDEILKIIFNDTKYSKWFEEYSEDPRQRQKLIEELIENKDPGGSYIFLANIINKGIFNNIFTTNFDDLINDSLLKYVDLKSKVYAHNEIAKYISIYSKKPNIIKLHGDFLFQSIKNTIDETQDLEDDLKFKLNEALKCLNLIVVGYSGFDNSVMNTLKETKKNTSFQLIWCITKKDFYNNTINWRVFDIINNYNNSFFILIDDFDTLIFNIWSKFNRPLVDLEETSKKRILLINGLLKKFDDQSVKNSTSITTKEKEIFRNFLNSQNYLKDVFLLIAQRQFENALDKLNKAIEIDPFNPNSYYGRSLVYYFLKNPNKALDDINKAIKLDNSKNHSYYSIRSKIFIAKNQMDNALRDLNLLFSIAPNDDATYNVKAMIFYEKKQYAVALDSINTAIKIKDDPSHYFIRSCIYLIKDRYEEALFDINKAIELRNFKIQDDVLFIQKIKTLILQKKYPLVSKELKNLNNFELYGDSLFERYLLEIILNIMLNHRTNIIWEKLENLIKDKTFTFDFDNDYWKNFAKKVGGKNYKEKILKYIEKIYFLINKS